MADTRILILFKKQLVSFCEELISQFPDEGDFVVMKLFVENQIPIKQIMDGFINQINKNDAKVRGMIVGRNDDFFINENPFKFMSAERTGKMSKLWRESMTQEDKDVIWNWVDVFVTITNKYISVT
jgi:hypothetical protein